MGTAWKWLAGSPDHHDKEIIINKINEQLENNNKQLIINKVLNDRIKQLSLITNNIIKATSENKNFIDEKISLLQYKLHILKEELNNLVHAIDWAKTDTINSIILSEYETEQIENLFNKEIVFMNLEELLEFSKIKIATNGKNLLYIISIPLISNETCTHTILKPIKKGKIIYEIKYTKIIQCNQINYGLKGNCETHNDKSICNKINLVDLSNDTCITPLLRSRTPNCKIINSQHVADHEEILTGTILLNDFRGTVLIDREETTLEGTFLVQSQNSTIVIANDVYETKMMTYAEAAPPVLQLQARESKVEEVLSLQMLKEFNINNTRELEMIRDDSTKTATINVSVTGTLLLALIAAIGWIAKQKLSHRGHQLNKEVETPGTKPKTPTGPTQKRLYIASEDVCV